MWLIHLLLANAVFVGLRHFLRGNLSAVLILYDRFYIDSILNRSWHLSVISLGSQDIFGVTRQSLTPGGPLLVADIYDTASDAMWRSDIEP